MKKVIGFCEFSEAFRDMNREDNFSYEGLRALFDYITEYEDSTGEEIELDVIALCCEFTEYEDLEEFQEDYGEEYESVEDIEYHTTVIMLGSDLDDGFIIQDF
jgi:hypothetical protein